MSKKCTRANCEICLKPVYHGGNGFFGVFVHVSSDASLFNMAFQMLDYENSASDADISQNSKI